MGGRKHMRLWAIALIASVGLSACNDIGLRDLRGDGDGPDEFLVLPGKPLQQPESFSVLPTPTPGGSNITDATPLQDGVTALGGRLSDPNAGIPAGDGAVVRHASRFGTDPAVREKLAEEDAAFRKRRARFTQIRLFRVDRYYEAYDKQDIDPHKVNTAYERAGVKTPTAPPPPRRRR